MKFFIASFDLFFVVCCCKIEQFSVLKPSHLSFLWAVSTQLAFNECLQEIQKKKKESIVLQSYCKKQLKTNKKRRAKFRKHQLRETKDPYPVFSGKISLDNPTHFTLYNLYLIHPTLTSCYILFTLLKIIQKKKKKIRQKDNNISFS